MTSSLVGSEMCIRDSKCTGSPLFAEGRTSCALPEPQDDTKEMKDASVPVSYTHLTLPTICSV
eukprot:9059114-Prorocentrum_lima.AAC.1